MSTKIMPKQAEICGFGSKRRGVDGEEGRPIAVPLRSGTLAPQADGVLQSVFSCI